MSTWLERQDRRYLEAPMARVNTLYAVDHQVEVARRYYPNGQLEAERLRTRVRQHYSPLPATEDLSFGGKWVRSLAGALYIAGWMWFGWWVVGGFWGVMVGAGTVAVLMALHWD